MAHACSTHPHAYTCAHTTQHSVARVHPTCTAHAHAPPRTLLEPPSSHLELWQPLDGLERPQDTQDPQGLDGVDVFPFGASRRQKPHMQGQDAQLRRLPRRLPGLRAPQATAAQQGQGLRKRRARPGQQQQVHREHRASGRRSSRRRRGPVLAARPTPATSSRPRARWEACRCCTRVLGLLEGPARAWTSLPVLSQQP